MSYLSWREKIYTTISTVWGRYQVICINIDRPLSYSIMPRKNEQEHVPDCYHGFQFYNQWFLKKSTKGGWFSNKWEGQSSVIWQSQCNEEDGVSMWDLGDPAWNTLSAMDWPQGSHFLWALSESTVVERIKWRQGKHCWKSAWVPTGEKNWV